MAGIKGCFSGRHRLIKCRATYSSRWSSARQATLTLTNAKGAELGPVLETIENALRADQTKMIEAR